MALTHRQDIIAIAAAVTWSAMLWASFFPQHPLLGGIVLTLAYILSCVGLLRAVRSGLQLSVLARVACVVAAALFTFAVWGNVIGVMPGNIVPKSAPHIARFLGLLGPGAIAVVATTGALLLPTALLLSRHYWIIPCVGCGLAYPILGPWPFLKADATVGASIVAIEWVSFAVLPAYFLMKLCPKVRRKLRVAQQTHAASRD
jgi:hypothetical protein